MDDSLPADTPLPVDGSVAESGSTDPAVDQSVLGEIVADALEQAGELADLDGPRAEAWASDLLALVDELGPSSHDAVIAQLVAAASSPPSAAAAAALWAVGAVTASSEIDEAVLEPAPRWAPFLGTSQCEAAWILRARRGESAAFRFVDADDARHVVVVDLVPGGGASGDNDETIGEVTVGPIALLDALDDPDSAITATALAGTDAAERVGRAWRCTTEPSPTLAMTCRVLRSRLEAMGVDGLALFAPVADDVGPPPERNHDDDAFALSILDAALGDLADPDPAVVADAASVLRAAAAQDDPIAQWLAASVGPVDLDDPDLDVVTAALASSVAPASLAPLEPAARRAVVELEWADWLGAVIMVVRAGAGESVDPDHLVDLVNRCPEVTSTIPKADRARVAWAFAVCTEFWTDLGMADDATLTEFGRVVLPLALRRAWEPISI